MKTSAMKVKTIEQQHTGIFREIDVVVEWSKKSLSPAHVSALKKMLRQHRQGKWPISKGRVGIEEVLWHAFSTDAWLSHIEQSVKKVLQEEGYPTKWSALNTKQYTDARMKERGKAAKLALGTVVMLRAARAKCLEDCSAVATTGCVDTIIYCARQLARLALREQIRPFEPYTQQARKQREGASDYQKKRPHEERLKIRPKLERWLVEHAKELYIPGETSLPTLAQALTKQIVKKGLSANPEKPVKESTVYKFLLRNKASFTK